MTLKTNIFLFILFALFASHLSAKPQSSLFLTINWLDEFVYGQPISLRVEVLSQINHEKMQFNLTLPSGVALIDGTKNFELAIEKGQPLFLDFTLMAEKGATGQVKAEATLGNSHQVFFRAFKTLTLGQTGASQKMQTYSTSTPSFRHTERNGVKLREYQLP